MASADKANHEWPNEELRAAVAAYRKMQRLDQAGYDYTKAAIRKELIAGPLKGRTEGSIEYRMQNISTVLRDKDLPWLTGYKPAKNVGTHVAQRIQTLLDEIPFSQNNIDYEEFVSFVRDQARKNVEIKTKGKRANFVVSTNSEGFIFVPTSSKKPRVHRLDYVRRVLATYERTQSFNTSHYKFTVNASYQLALMREFLKIVTTGTTQTGSDIGHLSSEDKLDPEEGWNLIREQALAALESGRLFTSNVQNQRYSVEKVLSTKIVINRIDAEEQANLGAKEVVAAIDRFNAAGVRCRARTLNYTTAKEQLLVDLHPMLKWSDDNAWILRSGNGSPLSVEPARFEEAEDATNHIGKEGARKLSTHRYRERDSNLIRKFKDQYIKLHGGNAPCEACSFDFLLAYPGRESPYIEAHHRVPLSDVDEKTGAAIRYKDIAFLCANCHRIIHRPFQGKYLSVHELTELVKSTN